MLNFVVYFSILVGKHKPLDSPHPMPSSYATVYHFNYMFTQEYLLSEGTELGNPLPIPADPYTMLRQSRAESPSRGSDLRPRSAPRAPPSLRGLLLK